MDFASAIQPLLAKKCFSCHGPDKQEGKIRFDNRESLIVAAESGLQAILPGESARSELVRRLLSNDEADRMPPEGPRLTDEQIKTVSKWIDQGAHFTAHWAFQPVGNPEIPAVRNTDWIRTPIDAFIESKLEKHDLQLSKAAAPQALIRRIYFDTIGLPPSPEEVDRLSQNWNDATYERLVDRLLADPAFGDRWGRTWLDVVRYAETNSYERDGDKPNAWKYRDYVIESMNEDKGYDQFIREQIAGDELDEVTTETLTATGYYRLGIWDDEPVDPLQAEFDGYDDVVTTTGQTFLALTINCARCHDHKIDPLPQKDYYSMVAFLRDTLPYGTRGDGRTNNQRDVTPADVTAQYQAADAEIDAIKKQMETIEQAGIVKMSAPDQRATEGPERAKVLREKLKDHLGPEEIVQYDALKAKRRDAEEHMKRLPQREAVLGLGRCEPNPPATFVLLRGSPQAPGVEVSPAFPKILGGDAPQLPEKPVDARSAHRRKVFADWLASKENWLTARVITNRVWQQYFGRGIVRSPNNFGLMGERPSHPELLDYLARDLMNHDWHLKHLHREILLSATYRQSSESNDKALAADPDNRLLWRQSIRRLSAEQVRDGVLAVSGHLNEQQTGPSIFQTLSAEVLASQSVPGKGWGKSSPSDQARRSIYIHVKRSLPVPMLSAFDLPETDTSCEARFLTTQPAQALGMLNSDWMQEQATALADRVRREAGDDLRAQARRALELTCSAPPKEADVEELLSLVDRLKTKHQFDDVRARRAMCLTALNLNQFLYLD
ncbi:MAG: PSD1 and planctomycete cytochrome C domain-containing protein [Pirellulales bacterium]